MKVTIIPKDGVMLVDGIPASVSMEGLPANVHAVQWQDGIGHVEHTLVNGEHLPHTTVNDLMPYQFMLDRYSVAVAQPVPTPADIAREEKDELLRQLSDLDMKSIRALRENNTVLLNSYEAAAEQLRYRVRELDAALAGP